MLFDHLLLYRHDLRSINILQLITTASEIVDGTLVEVVLSGKIYDDKLLIKFSLIKNCNMFVEHEYN